MAVCWITSIYNNTNKNFNMHSFDTSNDGVLKPISLGKPSNNGKILNPNPGGDMAWGKPVTIRAKSKYTLEFAGIPWFHDEKHYKTLEFNNAAIMFYTSYGDQGDDNNFIVFKNKNTGDKIARIKVPNNTGLDIKLSIVINDGKILFSVDNISTTGAVVFEIFKTIAGEWLKSTKEGLGTVLKKVLF
ncbi:hypothetical protein [Xenorhabdus cabanillasii]|uniref:Uncharacterized protein n=1 Tax=Xenorhabdus cabanillasii JM26 TaxID=1427517 RepID=W1J8G7_9GAMM|nr:hypothetical protein [Xenorhabdus cabanillasii]PHM76157.1 hypothetical protein Xcab_03362 [Xenorhabdus cabanillasii JM26]CDL87037.1 hypothetical protein XCR1_830012 [Xenorhabdus cabanillasii JM26]